MHILNTHAVSEVFGLLLILSLASTIISVTLFWGAERMTSEKETASTASAFNQLCSIDAALQDLPHQGENSSRIVNFVSDKGYVHLGSGGTRFVVFYSVNSTFWFNVTGLNNSAPGYNNEVLQILVYNGTIIHIEISYLNTHLPVEIPPLPNPLPGPLRPYVYKFVSNKALVDAVRIDIYNYSDYESTSANHINDLKGTIWIFDVGYLSYELPTQQSMEQMTIENGAVVTKNPSGYYIPREPPFYTGQYHFIMRAIQLKPESETTVGPGGSYKFIMTLKNLSIRENEIGMKWFSRWMRGNHGIMFYNRTYIPSRLTDYNFNIQVFGDNAPAWKYYLNSTFQSETGDKYQTIFGKKPDGTLYSKDYMSLSLHQLVYTVRVETG